jgi:hypothetical protein
LKQALKQLQVSWRESEEILKILWIVAAIKKYEEWFSLDWKCWGMDEKNENF